LLTIARGIKTRAYLRKHKQYTERGGKMIFVGELLAF